MCQDLNLTVCNQNLFNQFLSYFHLSVFGVKQQDTYDLQHWHTLQSVKSIIILLFL